ncbi:AraC family transcriptional regulator [Enterovibrio paralichthyis]|uniref:AraC family transcriptional regulator n=1 Tax=Enterovibrio paralichthyis TaxID=2853805 RepID=UPI001C486BD5|nr:AraC family transcriptional regulator [Enterovibrio paralichthyis]
MPQGIKAQETLKFLSDVFETMRFKGTIFFSSELSAPWGVSLKQRDFPRFHIAMRGDCYLGVQGHSPQQISEMDIFILPNGASHWIADQTGSKKYASEEVIEACELSAPMFQHGETTHELMCGLVTFEQGLSHPILQALPPVITLKHIAEDSTPWRLITLIHEYIKLGGIQRNPIVDKLAEALFLTLLCQFLNENHEKYSFIRAVHHRQLRQALELIHHEPGKDWTLEELGKQIGMSKATLVRHFQEALGVAPISYLNHWRRLKAYNALRYGEDSVEQIALSLGFVSGRTLSRALVREFGLTPAEIRQLSQN